MKTLKKLFGWLFKHLSFWAVMFGFLGTFIIVVDDYYPPIADRMIKSKWQNISAGIKDLDKMEFKKDRKEGILSKNETGFAELLKVIQENRTDFKGKITAIHQYKPTFRVKIGPMVEGDIDLSRYIIPEPRSIFVVLENAPDKPEFFIERNFFDEWIKQYRERFFLTWGMKFIWVGFLLAVADHFRNCYKAEEKPS